MFLELSLILIGVAIAALGWSWGGAGSARTSWLAVGAPGIVLAAILAFRGDEGISTWALAGAGAVFALVAAGSMKWGAAGDNTTGLFAFILAAAAGLSAGGLSKGAPTFSILSLAMVLVAVAAGLVFLAGFWPRVGVLRAIVGWACVVIGLAIGFLAYGPSIGVTFGTAGLG